MTLIGRCCHCGEGSCNIVAWQPETVTLTPSLWYNNPDGHSFSTIDDITDATRDSVGCMFAGLYHFADTGAPFAIPSVTDTLEFLGKGKLLVLHLTHGDTVAANSGQRAEVNAWLEGIGANIRWTERRHTGGEQLQPYPGANMIGNVDWIYVQNHGELIGGSPVFQTSQEQDVISEQNIGGGTLVVVASMHIFRIQASPPLPAEHQANATQFKANIIDVACARSD